MIRIKIKTKKVKFSEGTAGGFWRIQVFDSDGALVERQKNPAPQGDFELDNGHYRVAVDRLSMEGFVLGPTREADFDVPPVSGIMIEVADGVEVMEM